MPQAAGSDPLVDHWRARMTEAGIRHSIASIQRMMNDSTHETEDYKRGLHAAHKRLNRMLQHVRPGCWG